MRRRLLLGGALLGAFVVALSQGAGSPTAALPRVEPPPTQAPRAAPAPVPEMRRNPFEFAGEPAAHADEAPASLSAEPVLAPATPAPAPARLVGFVFQAGRLRAALVFGGETYLLGLGEEAAGYTLLSADESAGVRLRTPAGNELALAVPE